MLASLHSTARKGLPAHEPARMESFPLGGSSGIPSLKAARSGDTNYALVDLASVTREVLMIAPSDRGCFGRQAEEVLEVQQTILANLPQPATVTIQTVFLRDARDRAECQRIFSEHYGLNAPVTNFVVQPPCCGAALAVEAWAIGGESVRLERFGSQALTVDYQGMRWIYCTVSPPERDGVHAQASEGFRELRALLEGVGSGFEHVVRTWLYLGGITNAEGHASRYQELNRARAEFFRDIPFGSAVPGGKHRHALTAGLEKSPPLPSPLLHPVEAREKCGQCESDLMRERLRGHRYPASTGIGMQGTGLAMSCMALETTREDVFVLPIENPGQTPAYSYEAAYSPQSPKFSRAMTLVTGQYATIWISGTASIVNSESRHPGDIERQTEQAINNIARLIAPDNLSQHGLKGAGAALNDLAKIRVYVKRAEDFQRCRGVCERRFGAVPALYLQADICRPELLVEIEGVAFSKIHHSDFQ